MPDMTSLITASSSHGLSSTQLLLGILLINALASIVLAALGLLLRPSRLRGHWQRDYLALLGIGLLIPLLGPVFILLNLLLYHLLQYRQARTSAQHLELSPFVPEPPRMLDQFGVGGAVHGLKGGSLETGKSIRALMAVEQQRSGRTSRVLFDTLSHTDESVRLTAAGLLNRRESRIQKLSLRVENAIRDTPQDKDELLAVLHMEAAELNAEMLYLSLAREGMAYLYLQRWGQHLDRAEPYLSNTPAWLISKARWMDQSKIAGSTELYQSAASAGAAPARVLPYLAERCWEQRDYRQIAELVRDSDLFAALPIAGPLVQRWHTQQEKA